MTLSDSVESLSGIGVETAKLLHKLNVYTLHDLLNYYPRKYIDYSKITQIEDLQPGIVSIKVTIDNLMSRYVRAGLHITEATASDATGRVKLVWFNQPYRAKSISPNKAYYVAGVFEFSGRNLSIVNPTLELVSAFPAHTARIIPVYKETKGLKSSTIRKALRQVIHLIDDNADILPAETVKSNDLVSHSAAIQSIHFPDNQKKLDAAKHRMAFGELFELLLASRLIKQEIISSASPAIAFKKSIIDRLLHHLPYQLTNSQKIALWQIYKDLEKPHPMNRLIEGDVGSGKTAVAALAAAMAVSNGYQVAYMAPTELLAGQHFKTFSSIFKSVGKIKSVALLTAGIYSNNKKVVLENIKNGDVGCVVGTHALIQKSVEYHNLGLVIVDEQHRFGVNQRNALMAKSKLMPHLLTMTATPIPRSLALAVYGELDISLMKEKPSNRKPIHTATVPLTERTSFYKSLHKRILAGEQCFVVCPLIDEDETGSHRSVNAVYKELRSIFSDCTVGLLHGKLDSFDKNKTLDDFRDKQIDVLVATTVIEVGVDIPDANIMVIESVEKYGLAQIHQLRGRVGRGNKQGECYLLLSQSGLPSPRIRAVESTDDGFKLAELDLKLRGPGAMYVTYQHGKLDLRMADFTDSKLVRQVASAVDEFMNTNQNLVKYPRLQQRITDLQTVTNLN